MSAALRLSTVVMLGAGGLFTGGVVWYAWERVWIWRRLTLPEYAVDFRRSVRKADPALPILLVICAAGAGAFGVAHRRRRADPLCGWRCAAGDDPDQLDHRRRADQQPVPPPPRGNRPPERRKLAPVLATLPPHPHGPGRRCVRRSCYGGVLRLSDVPEVGLGYRTGQYLTSHGVRARVADVKRLRVRRTWHSPTCRARRAPLPPRSPGSRRSTTWLRKSLYS
jgi:hypothetical protein